jgi:hypothetical protein
LLSYVENRKTFRKKISVHEIHTCVHFSLQLVFENIFLFGKYVRIYFRDAIWIDVGLLMKNLLLPVYGVCTCVCVSVLVLVCVCLWLLFCMCVFMFAVCLCGRFFRVLTFPLQILIPPTGPHSLIILSPMLH